MTERLDKTIKLLKETDEQLSEAMAELVAVNMRHAKESREAQAKVNTMQARISSLISLLP